MRRLRLAASRCSPRMLRQCIRTFHTLYCTVRTCLFIHISQSRTSPPIHLFPIFQGPLPHLDLHCVLRTPRPLVSMNRSNSTASSAKLRKSPQRYQLHHQQTQTRTRVPEPVHWLFRSNIPRRRTSFIPVDPRKRNFFGIGEIVGVLKNVCLTYL